MHEDTKIRSGRLYAPGHPELRARKLICHNLCTRYNALFEDQTDERAAILGEVFAAFGEGSFIQGPMQIHYGSHTMIGRNFFGNFNLVIQDDGEVVIGDDVSLRPNVTIVTPLHPLLPDERDALYTPDGEAKRLCWAKPVRIGNQCWIGANVVILPGVTIGNGCVIGAGSVVTRDIPDLSLAYGNPCRVIRTLSEADSMVHRPELLEDYRVDRP